jgi:hypothetical protein
MINNREIDLGELRRIGWDIWDPIGVHGLAPADEYDTYLLHVAGLLCRGASTREAVSYLDAIATDHMGIGPITAEGHAASERTVEAISHYLRG